MPAIAEDHHVVEVAPGRTMALRLHVSFTSSLFQRLGTHIRLLRRGAIMANADLAPLAGFAAACPPIEILRWGEYAARDATALADVEDMVKERARAWAVSLVAAMTAMADTYRTEGWLDDRAALLETQDWLARALLPVKDDIILGMRRGLVLPEDNRSTDVVLVRQTYDQAGGHSHPALVDTSRFVGSELVEVLFHEVGHELFDRCVGLDRSGIVILYRILEAAAPAQAILYDILHVLLFAQVGNLVRQYFDPLHQPLIYKSGRLIRLLQKIGVSASQSDVLSALDQYAAGNIKLDDLAHFFIDQSARPMRPMSDSF